MSERTWAEENRRIDAIVALRCFIRGSDACGDPKKILDDNFDTFLKYLSEAENKKYHCNLCGGKVDLTNAEKPTVSIGNKGKKDENKS